MALQWVDSVGEFESSTYNGSTYTTVAVPGFIETGAHGIDKNGDIAFSVIDLDGNAHGGVLKAGSFYFFDDPTGTQTRADGINDGGVVVGRFLQGNGTDFDGFDATF